jgi:hypothetical protein
MTTLTEKIEQQENLAEGDSKDVPTAQARLLGAGQFTAANVVGALHLILLILAVQIAELFRFLRGIFFSS